MGKIVGIALTIAYAMAIVFGLAYMAGQDSGNTTTDEPRKPGVTVTYRPTPTQGGQP